MPEQFWISAWRWSTSHVGWFAHTPAFTAYVAYERSARAPGLPPMAVANAAAASRFSVAIVGPTMAGRPTPGHSERYVLRGSLVDVRAKLEAALERRQRQYAQRRASAGPAR